MTTVKDFEGFTGSDVKELCEGQVSAMKALKVSDWYKRALGTQRLAESNIRKPLLDKCQEIKALEIEFLKFLGQEIPGSRSRAIQRYLKGEQLIEKQKTLNESYRQILSEEVEDALCLETSK